MADGIRFDSAFNIADSITLAAAVSLPFIKSIVRRYRVESEVRYLNLIKTKSEIEEFLVDDSTETYLVIRSRLAKTLKDIEGEINAIETQDNVFIHSVIAYAIEIFLLAGFMLAGALRSLNVAVFEKSSVTKLYFLEGIFKYPEIRMGILLHIIAASVFASKFILDRIPLKYSSATVRYAWFFGFMNVSTVVLTIMLCVLLYITDPYSPIW
jgi:hypothetical protein